MRRMIVLCLVLLSSQAIADVKLPRILSTHMVLQRDQEVNIWGWADPGEKVTVTLAGKHKTVTADDSGDWLVVFPAQKANKVGQEIKVKGNNEIILRNVLFGDVWLGSGQSNMGYPLYKCHERDVWLGSGRWNDETIAASENANLRLYHVSGRESPKPLKDIVSYWTECNPKTTFHFSAVLYYFGRMVNAETDVPMGLISSAVGGSPIEPWQVNGGKYNAMIAPLHNFKIKGFLWYQGESNIRPFAKSKVGMLYFDKQKLLIESWREKWGNDELPFYFVQIAPHSGYTDGDLPLTWEAQCKTLTIPRTGMAVTTDTVNKINDIHPRNKKVVGERLARWALVFDYGKKMDYSGPLYKKHKVSGSKIVISFAHVGEGLVSRDGKPLNEFQIAGEDGKFVAATAEIKGNTVVVSAESVKAPLNIRFGWHRRANPNLMNKAGLPASPFQTDNWQGGTGETQRTQRRGI